MKKTFLYLLGIIVSATGFTQVTTNGGSGLAANYASLANAITALNGATISSPVMITLTGNETAPAGGYTITAQGSMANPITITASSSAVTVTANAALTAGSLNDGIIKLVGADYVTLTGFTLRENEANTTTDEFTNNMTEWAIALLPGSGTNGAQNNTIRAMDIALNKTYANSFAIYSSTAHTGADVTLVEDITAASGGNDNLLVVSNTISNVNIPVAVVGSPAFPGLGLNIGGSTSLEGNNFTNWGTTAFYAAFARFDNSIAYQVASSTFTINPVPGILAVNQLGPNISHNTLVSSTAGNTDGAILGIYAPTNGAIAYPGTPFTTNINANKFNLYSDAFGTSTAVPLIYGIRIHTGDALGTLHLDSTEFLGVNHVTPDNQGADTLIYSFAQVKHLTMNANKFNNLQIGHNGGLAFMAIQGRVFMPVDGTQNIKNNTISGLVRTYVGGTSTVGILKGVISTPSVATDGSEAGSSFNAENNIFSNIITNGGGFNGITNFDGKQNLGTLTKNIIGNTFSGIDTWLPVGATSSGGAVTFASFTNRGGAHNISNNTIENIKTTNNTGTPLSYGSITGINSTGFFAGITYSVTGNIMRNCDGGQLQGANFNGPATISNNQFYGWNGRASTGAGNSAISMTAIPAGATVNITKNKIGDITNPITGPINAINTGAADGIAATVNIYNNLIGNLKTPVSTNPNAINGINLTGGSSLVADVAHNTIYLNATSSSVTIFGTSCMMFNATLSSLKLRNNILMNLSTPAQEGLNSNENGISAVLRRNAIGTIGLAPANYDVASNNNLFYANPTAGSNNHLTYVEGGLLIQSNPLIIAPIGNSQNTLAEYKTFMANPDQASVTENTNNSPFKSLDVASADFLHVSPQFIFAANNAGMALSATVADDFDGEARNAATPDMGADEYATNSDAWLLPVGLVSLSGTKQGTDNLLSWITASEQNNRGFDVQRSLNGTEFTTIGFVGSKAQGGNSQTAVSYQFTDPKAAGSAIYYRLVQNDLDGKTHLSNMILLKGIAPEVASFEKVYPNPADGTLTLVVNALKQDKATIAVTDAGGRVMMQQQVSVVEGTNSINLNVRGLNGGIYFISVKMDQLNKAQSLRFMKR